MKKIFEKLSYFFSRFGMPFLLILLSGAVIYLIGVIGNFISERRSVELLLHASEPNAVFEIPKEVDAKKWQTFLSASGGVSFKYPMNWRFIKNVQDENIVREGEDAVISVGASDAGINGESMVAYRVARIAALQELNFPVEAIQKAVVANKTALVLKYKSAYGGNIFYETTFLDNGFFHTIVLGIKNFSVEARRDSIVDEYKKMLATIFAL